MNSLAVLADFVINATARGTVDSLGFFLQLHLSMNLSSQPHVSISQRFYSTDNSSNHLKFVYTGFDSIKDSRMQFRLG